MRRSLSRNNNNAHARINPNRLFKYACTIWGPKTSNKKETKKHTLNTEMRNVLKSLTSKRNMLRCYYVISFFHLSCGGMAAIVRAHAQYIRAHGIVAAHRTRWVQWTRIESGSYKCKCKEWKRTRWIMCTSAASEISTHQCRKKSGSAEKKFRKPANRQTHNPFTRRRNTQPTQSNTAHFNGYEITLLCPSWCVFLFDGE